MTVFSDLTSAVERLNNLLGQAQVAGYHLEVLLDVNDQNERTVQWDIHNDASAPMPDLMTYHLILRQNCNGHGHTPFGRAEFAALALTELLTAAKTAGVTTTPEIDSITNRISLTMEQVEPGEIVSFDVDGLPVSSVPVVRRKKIEFEKPKVV